MTLNPQTLVSISAGARQCFVHGHEHAHTCTRISGYYAGTETRQYCEGHACEGSRLQTSQVCVAWEADSVCKCRWSPTKGRGTPVCWLVAYDHVHQSKCGTYAWLHRQPCPAPTSQLLTHYTLPCHTLQLLKFAQEGWRTQPPRTGCTSPVSRCGKAVGSITRHAALGVVLLCDG